VTVHEVEGEAAEIETDRGKLTVDFEIPWRVTGTAPFSALCAGPRQMFRMLIPRSMLPRDEMAKQSVPHPTVSTQLIRVYGGTAVNTGYYAFSYIKGGETKNWSARRSFT
jgi:hypothetical protein